MYVIIDDVENVPISIISTIDEAMPCIKEYIKNSEFDMETSEFSIRKISNIPEKIKDDEKEN